MTKNFKFAAIFAAMLALLFASCKTDPKPTPEDTLEAKIKTIKITNGGISGGDLITGVVDSLTITFNDVPAETNIAAVKFQATVSLGAYLESDVIDFTKENESDATTLIGHLKCINKTDKATKEETYQVILKLKDPVSAPVIEKIVMLDDKGAEHVITSANIMDGLLCLGMPESSSATIVDVQLSPARSIYIFTGALAGYIEASNPGYFEMEFMGLKSPLYEVTFASSPTPGADWSQAVVHDFSLNTGNLYSDLAQEFTRGGDFDGEYVLMVTRSGDGTVPAPKLLAVADLLNDNAANPIMLDVTGIAGGTHIVSAGRLSHGHIYICNLATKVDDTEGTAGPLKVYHYASPTATPEVVLTWNGTGITNAEADYTARIGDNISVNLDESGNGYVYFFKQEADNKFFRFAVTNFTQFSAPEEFELPAVCNYYGMMNQVGDNQYLFTSTYVAMMWLFDKDANVLREFEWDAMGEEEISVSHATDPRIINFNRSRYLMLSNARRFLWWATEGVHVFDISEGNDVVSALVKLQEAQDAETLLPCFSYELTGNEANTAACVALCNAAERDGKLLIWAAAPHVGMCLIEVPKMK